MAVKRELSQIPAAVRNGSGIVSALSWLTNYTNADNDLAGAPPYRHPAHLRMERKHTRAHGSPPALHTCTHVCVCAFVAPGHALRQQPFLTDLETQLGTAEGGAAAVAALAALRAVLLQPQRMNVFVAGDLTKLPSPHAALAAALRPPSGAPAAVAAPPAAGPISGVEQHRLLSGSEAQVVAATLSATGTRCAMHHAPCGAPRDASHNTPRIYCRWLSHRSPPSRLTSSPPPRRGSPRTRLTTPRSLWRSST